MDPTESLRKELVEKINAEAAADRAEAEKRYGKVWNTEELKADFEVKGFAAPFIVVKRRSDGKMGSMEFQHSPRFYYSFVEDP